jgi:hypothetical protein
MMGRVIYVDLGCPLWRAVEIRAGGWRIVDRVPREVKFLRSRGMGRLPDPEAGDMIETLREFVNVESDDDFKLLLAWLVAAIRPRGPFPVLVILGEPGSAKSSLVRLCKRLIDPSRPEHRALPKDDRDLFIAASSNAVLAFDNISRMPEWLSDSFCRLATGGGFGTRRLQTDAEEMLFDAMRPVVLNGIGDVTPRSDLASRALQLTLPALANPRPEVEFYAALDAKWALILGALLDAVAAGLRRLPDVTVDAPGRMPDFAQWGEACSAGFGWEPGEFLTAYAENQGEVVAGVADASLIVPLIEKILVFGCGGPEGFDGTASELLVKLRDQATEKRQEARWFPQTPARMGTQLRRDTKPLKARGIEVLHYREGRKKTRKIVVRCKSEPVFEELRARLRGDQPPPGGGEG